MGYYDKPYGHNVAEGKAFAKLRRAIEAEKLDINKVIPILISEHLKTKFKQATASETQPYRVIYKARGARQITSKVFPNLAKATDFLTDESIKELILIQPASEPPPKINKENKFTQRLEGDVPDHIKKIYYSKPKTQ